MRSGFPDWRDPVAMATVAVLAAAAIVAGVSQLPINIWDEARLAINALEMTSTGNLLVPTFHWEPDLWNPKPTLATCLAAMSVWLFGINELALRLPSIIAAIATTFTVFGFTRWISASRATGVLAAAILLGSGGYVEVHVARTADTDSLLVLFLTLSTLALFRSVEERESDGSPGWLLLSAAAFACAILAKGVAALLVLPGYAIALLVLGRLKPMLGRRSTWSGIALVVGVAVLYWGAAELIQPGYFAAAWKSDIAGRLARVSDANGGPWYYYLVELVRPWQVSTVKGLDKIAYGASAFPWSLAVPLLAPILLLTQRGRIARAATFLLATLVAFLIVLSAAATKLPWYVAPAYPMIAIVVALEIHEFARWLSSWRSAMLASVGRAVVSTAVLAAVLCVGLAAIRNRHEVASAAFDRDARLPRFLQLLPKRLVEGRSLVVVSDAQWMEPAIHGGRFAGSEPYDAPVEFYVAALRSRGADVRIVHQKVLPAPGQLVIGCGLGVPVGHVAVLARSGECAAVRRSAAPELTAPRSSGE
jgi:4-amino-4-deoxy-L-arabinose transferase-like glycosyltransferase